MNVLFTLSGMLAFLHRCVLVPFLLLVLGMFGAGTSVLAQSGRVPMEFTHYSVEEGLSDRDARAMVRDRQGYLWVATANGLNRFDGYAFLQFDNSAINPYKVSTNLILNIFLDRTGQLFVYGDNMVIDRLDPVSGRLTAVKLDQSNGFHGQLNTVFQDKKGVIYAVGVEKTTFYIHGFNEQNGSFELLTTTVFREEIKPVSIKIIRASDGTFWLSYLKLPVLQTVLQHLDANGKILHTYEQADFVGKGGQHRIYNILETPGGEIWVYIIDNGVFVISAQPSGQFSRHPQIQRSTYYIASDTLGNIMMFDVSPDPAKSCLYTTDGKLLDYTAVHEAQRSGALKMGYFSTIYSENFYDRFYVCSLKGITQCRIVQQSIKAFQWDTERKSRISSTRSMIKTAADKLLVATEENHLFSFDLLTEQITWLPRTNLLSPSGGVFLPRSMFAQGDSVIWITSAGGLLQYNIANNSIRRLMLSIPLPGEPVCGTLDADGVTIIIPSNTGLFFIRSSDGQARIYQNNDGSNPLYNTTPTYILRGNDGILWVGTNRAGLVRIEPRNGVSKTYQQAAGFNSMDISFLFQEPSGLIWVGTVMGGLHLFDPAQEKVVAFYTRDNGLPSNSIAGMLPASDGNYWVSTYNGLCHFNTRDKTFRNYTEADGLAHNEFNRFSFFRDEQTGRYFFGGLDGISAFFEDDMKAEANQSPVLVSEISYYNGDGEPVVQKMNVYDGMTITLPAFNRTLSLRMALAHYDKPAKNQFSYMLEGIDKKWNFLGNNHDLRFSYLPAGSYTLRIRGADGRGNWSQREMTIRIHVQEFWYLRWWAFLLYALLLGGGGYLLYRIRLKQKLNARETQRLQELDAFKSRFFTNITHEFRTPLTVILGNTEMMEKELENLEKNKQSALTAYFKPKVDLVKRSGENLLRLINEILDLAKLENNSLSLHYVHADLVPFLRYIAESMHSLANTRNVMLRMESSEAMLLMDYDPERLLQIVHNLLSNAIKFTPSGGKVWLRVSVENGGPSAPAHVLISVTDTGVGIAPDELPQVFDRFYQAKNQEHNKAGGSGIGLSLTRELVKVMEGSIQVESTPNEGTTFMVKLPIRHQVEVDSASQYVVPSHAMPPSTKPVVAPAETDQADSDSPLLLLIEDNLDVVEYLASCLQSAYRLEFAYNGRIGIEKALELTPDLVISDVMMPEKDGFEVCDALKNDQRSSHIPVILLTARADTSSRIAGLRRGADVYLSKPFNREELLAHVTNLLELRRKLQSRYAAMTLDAPEAPAPDNLEDAFLTSLRTLIEDNINKPGLTPEFICQKMGMSRTNLHRKITALTNLPLTMYIRNLRLQQAKTLLQTTDMNVSEVSFAVGIDDPKYFSRVFSETFGTPPSAMKK